MNWSYSRCAACDCSKRQVRPSGPTDYYELGLSPRIMLIGEGPGFHEDRTGIPFVGVSGKELDRTYLPLARLRREDIFVTNVVQCRQERNGVDVRPSEQLAKVCAANHLMEEIWAIMPEIIILCGAAACALVGELSKLEFEHGFPRQVNDCEGLFGWSGIVVPMYHPAAGMHESRYMIPQIEDWECLGMYLRGEWKPPTVQALTKKQKPNYFLAVDEPNDEDGEVERYFCKYAAAGKPGTIAIDTESDEGKDWSIQVSVREDTGLMVLIKNTKHIKELVTWVNFLVAIGWELVFHHAQADLDLAEHIGINCTVYRDTMQELYHLGNLPQGLKPAVYRILGKRMMSYVDVVLPWSKSVLLTWLADALNEAANMADIIPHPVGKNCPTCGKTHRKDVSKTKPHESEAVLRRVMKYVEENPDYDPWIKPKTNGRGETAMRLFGRGWLHTLESAVGRMPRASIVHVPISIACEYGCSDADHTGQLAAALKQERLRIVQQEWKVA